jgi:hypothetical protein
MTFSRLVGAALLATVLLLQSGCARNYVLTLANGAQIPAKSKPQLKSGNYYFKDGAGRDAFIPAGRVREISPASMVSNPESKFQAPSAK